MIRRYYQNLNGDLHNHTDGGWITYFDHLAEVDARVKAAVKKERERILAAIGTRYPDQYSREMDRAIREIEIIVRERGEG